MNWIVNAETPEGLYLRQADPVLAKLIERIGEIRLTASDSPYESLIGSIVSQMLSAKVAAVIRQRLSTLNGGPLTPAAALALDDDAMRGAGLSYAKIRSIKDVSARTLSGELDYEALSVMPEPEAVAHLAKAKGIGRWTAEMFLIFSLGRPDVLSLGDAGLQRAAQWLYSLADPSEAPGCLERHAVKWRPYRSIACLYLWRAIDDGYVDGRTRL
ncbi:DNA-3-methyladenine glycosylase family protein [Cohnella sp. JJ-181]|uniref:DNA-3-methyladenine glycosylase family protein n=1 Tax=Cohnella rhizoplanae TaxID=2974897 RepID=UPI0022FF9416|nr:DNA-3-methyladenine glycosylase 2 family protein [Cohnella sp. JJ-181]CAI6080618.1 DNA-3-methyladenine glycosylase [Cohnella sp. JJ-181]